LPGIMPALWQGFEQGRVPLQAVGGRFALACVGQSETEIEVTENIFHGRSET
jgi:hypothetical protein